METFKQKILEQTRFYDEGIFKVDNFLNHRMDISLLSTAAREFHRIFKFCDATIILTMESAGIGIACLTAQYFDNIPVLFAKRTNAKTYNNSMLNTRIHSYSKQKDYTVRIDKSFLTPSDRVLILDDFIANGAALTGLIDIVHQSGAEIVGAGVCLEMGFRKGGDLIREMDINYHPLAIMNVDDTGKAIITNI